MSFSKWNSIVALSWDSLLFLLAEMEETDPDHLFCAQQRLKKEEKEEPSCAADCW